VSKAVVRQRFCCDRISGYITFLYGDIMCLSVLCLSSTDSLHILPRFSFFVCCSIYFSKRTSVLLAPAHHSELLVSCWVALERVSRELWHCNTNPSLQAPPVLPRLCPGDHLCVFLSSSLQLKQKRDGKSQGNQSSPSPPKMSAAELTL